LHEVEGRIIICEKRVKTKIQKYSIESIKFQQLRGKRFTKWNSIRRRKVTFHTGESTLKKNISLQLTNCCSSDKKFEMLPLVRALC